MPERLHLIEDIALLKLYRTSQNVQYIGELYRRYAHLILGVCMKYLKNREDSEDAVMEIFEKLHLDLKKNEVEHPKSWLYMVARNHCLMRLRKAGLAVEYPEELPHTPLHGSPYGQYNDENEGFEDKEKLIQMLEKSVNHLKNEQKLCIELFYLKDKSYKDIVKETGFSLNEIKSHVQNGKANLKKMMLK
jgi:RNA polymerase sigma factor (sigma-70 family)